MNRRESGGDGIYDLGTDGRKKKCYVTVTAMHYINGLNVPQLVETSKGRFMVEKIKNIQKLSPQNDLQGG